MTKPPLNQLIEWDGSETPPVPEGAIVTVWMSSCSLGKDRAGGFYWPHVTAYLVHEYPKEGEVVDYWIELSEDGHPYGSRKKIDESDYTANLVHLRFTNGIAEIVSQEK